MRDELHIASFLVQYRADALPRLQDAVAALDGLEIAAQDTCRCVVLCESDNPRALMDGIDALQLLDGVVNVSLIYHHAESREALDAPLQPGIATQGASP